MANRYSKALKHLKSTEIDEKIKGLEEAAPTNNMGGVYYKGPAGQRFGNRSPEKVFYPDADGNFPSGIPGTAGDPSYTRPEGYWDSGPGATAAVEYDNVYEVDWSHPDSSNVRDTSGLIENGGYVKAQLPPNSRSFILGPLVDGYTFNHGYDDFTSIGYIQKDTRQFILLARISGHWNNTDPVYNGNPTTRVWDGTSTGFTAYNENFTLAMAQWFRNKILNKKEVGKNVSYYYSGGIGQTGNSDPDAPSGSYGGNGVGGPGHGSGGEDDANTGSQQNDPEQGGWDPNDPSNAKDDDKQEKLDEILDKISKGEPLTAEEEQWLRDNGLGDFADEYGGDGNAAGDWISELAALGISYAIVKLLLAAGFGWLLRGVLKGKNTVDDVMDIAKKLKGKVDEADDILDKLNDLMQALEGELGFNGWQAMDALRKLGKHGLARKISDAMDDFENGVNNAKIIRDLMKQAKKVLDGAKAVEPDVIKDFADISKKLHKIFKGLKTEAGRIEFKDDGSGLQQMYNSYQAAVKNGQSTSSYLRQIKSLIKKMSNPSNYTGLSNSYEPEGQVLSESRSRILREIKKPVLVPELPKKYKMNFKGKFRPQNTPDVTASKESDKGVKAKNAAGQAWRTNDKSWATYETNERMNIIFDQVGHGNQAWDMIVAEAKRKNGWKNREIQEQLNIIAHEKAMRAENPDYESPWSLNEMGASSEEELNTVMKDPLVKKVSKRLRKEIDYKDKPARQGYPNDPPAKQVDGWHPKYGKKYKYDKLDPVSAVTMRNAPTGDPEIDANVAKASKKAKEEKRIAEEIEAINDEYQKRKYDWRKELIDEGMTTGQVFSYQLGGSEDNPIEVTDINTTTADSFEDGEDNSLDNIMFRATDIEASGTGSGDDGGFNIGSHLAVGTETNSDGSHYQGTSTRHAFLKPIDARYIDTMVVTAIRGNGSNGGKLPTSGHNDGQDLRLMWFNEDRVDGWQGIGSWMTINISGKSPHWTYNRNPDGSHVSSIIIPRYHFKSDYGNAYNLADPEAYPELRDWVIKIPEWCKNKNQRFGFYQQYIGFGGFNYGITEIKYQRRTPGNVVVPLDSPEATSFIRLGQGNKISDPKKRKKKVDDILKASKQYVNKVVADPFPGTDAEIGEAAGTGTIQQQKWADTTQRFVSTGTLDQQLDKFVGDVKPAPNYSEVQNQEDPQDTEPKYPTDKTSDELISDLKIPDRNDFNYKQVGKYDSKGYEKAVTEYHNKVFDIIMEKHDPLNNPNFMANTDYTPNDTLIKRMRVYEGVKDTSRAVRQSAYMYQSPNTGYIDVMTGKTTQYQPPIDVNPTNSHNHSKIYPGSPEFSEADFRGIPPSHYWSAEITDSIAFLYQRGPDGLVYRNINHIGNPEKGEDPKKFLKALMRKTNSLRNGSPPLSPLELVNYHRQFTKSSSKSPTGTHRPGEARYQSYIARIKEVFTQRGMEHNIPEEKYSSSPPSADVRNMTSKERYRYQNSIRAKAGLVDFEQSEKEYKKIFDRQRKEGRHKKGDWHGYKITSKDERGLTKTATERKPRTYQNDRAERWFDVKMRAEYFLGEEKISESFDKLKKIRKKFDYEGKPTPTEDGLPEKPPAEIDPQTGFHPEYGKRVKRYGKLDPQSAESMPPTGDKDIDTTVQSQVDQKKKARKVKNLVGKNKK